MTPHNCEQCGRPAFDLFRGLAFLQEEYKEAWLCRGCKYGDSPAPNQSRAPIAKAKRLPDLEFYDRAFN